MLNENYIEKILEMEDIKVTKVENFPERVHLHIESKSKIHICPKCKSETSKIHDYRTQKVLDLSIAGKRTYLCIRKKRYHCDCCNKHFYEKIQGIPKYRRTTDRLWWQVFKEMENQKSMKLIGKELGISGTSVARIFDYISYTKIYFPKVIAIDEFKGNTGGEKYQTIITNPKKREVLDILPNRKKDDLYHHFSKIQNKNNVEIVVMDMSNHFRNIVKDSFPNAKIVADKYHVVRQVSWAFENVRKRVQKDFHPSKRKYFKRSKRLLLKGYSSLSDEERSYEIFTVPISS